MFLRMIGMKPPVALLLALMVNVSHGQSKPVTANKPATQSVAKPTGKPHASSSFTEKVLQFLGISDSPSTLKGPGDEVVRGEVWIADRTSGTTRAVTADDSYRSPVFIPGQNAILAMQEDNVVRIALGGQPDTVLSSHKDIAKLIGVGLEDPDKVLVLFRGSAGEHPRVGSLSLSTGHLQAIPYDPKSPQDLQMLESLQGWSRTYGKEYVYIQRQTKEAMSGTIEWTDVFLSSSSSAPVNLSSCNGQYCGQPSLSQDTHLLAFVKSRPK
jgi:hypothetical protein